MKLKRRRYSWTLPDGWTIQKLAVDSAVASDPTIPEALATAIQNSKTPRGLIRAIRIYANGQKEAQEKIETARSVQAGRESSVTVAHPNLT